MDIEADVFAEDSNLAEIAAMSGGHTPFRRVSFLVGCFSALTIDSFASCRLALVVAQLREYNCNELNSRATQNAQRTTSCGEPAS